MLAFRRGGLREKARPSQEGKQPVLSLTISMHSGRLKLSFPTSGETIWNCNGPEYVLERPHSPSPSEEDDSHEAILASLSNMIGMRSENTHIYYRSRCKFCDSFFQWVWVCHTRTLGYPLPCSHRICDFALSAVMIVKECSSSAKRQGGAENFRPWNSFRASKKTRKHEPIATIYSRHTLICSLPNVE